MYKLGLEKAGEPEVKLPTCFGPWRKQGSSRKTSTSASLTMLKPLTVWITKNCGKSLNRWEYQITLPASWETCMQVKKQQLEPYMKQQIGSKLGKESVKAVYCHPAYLTYIHITLCEMLSWTNHSWNQDFWEKHQQPQICRWYHSNGRKGRDCWCGWKRRVKKLAWNSTFKNLRSWHLVPSLHSKWKGKRGGSDRFYFHGLQNHCGQWLQPWN